MAGSGPTASREQSEASRARPLSRKECLRILLRGKPPIIVCPVRSVPQRLAPELRAPLEAGRLLLLTPFPISVRRENAELAAQRNLLVAALADEHWFAHITPDGQSERLAGLVSRWSSGTG